MEKNILNFAEDYLTDDQWLLEESDLKDQIERSEGFHVETQVNIEVKNFNFYYGDIHALKKVNMEIFENTVVGIIGPSGCGKSTFLRCFNRMNDSIANVRHSGDILIDRENILDKDQDVMALRKNVGMVFQKPNPFPMSIYDNIAYGMRINGVKNKTAIECKVEESLRDANLWDEVKDRLKKSAMSLSGGQQQRLCIARALAAEPRILLLDEPASALDPISTAKIEELIQKLKESYTILIVTHNMEQARRVTDFTAFFMMGNLVEYDLTGYIFEAPRKRITEYYVHGQIG
ncbi:MAG: phosphate ABC transporter ATP-binding protein [Candidatus Omnitrophica bacterium]|nr:phosphate ABC transporter ATP-binding protein [Candidatus Omnitrophota bacterium]